MPTAVESKEWKSPAYLADLIDVPLRTVYEWNATGTGPRFIRAGKHVRYHVSDIESWLKARAQGGAAA